MKPRNFQEATIRAVMTAFASDSGRRRFLVADEPGLGKTMVARGVMKRMATPDRPLVVLYVCSNQAIASQNVVQLLGSDAAARKRSADRPGLLPLDPVSEDPIRVYSLTPGTAFANQKNPGRGRVDERAFACALLEHSAHQPLPWVRKQLSQDTARFVTSLQDMGIKVADRAEKADFASFAARFEQYLKRSIKVRRSGPIWELLQEWASQLTVKRPDLAVVSVCRNCLAAAALSQLKPGLVIFDEFQRFQELLEESDDDATEAESLIRNILTAANRGRLLLLSATPYEALRSALSVAKPSAKGRRHTRVARKTHDFNHLLRFLWRNTPEEADANLKRVGELFGVRDAEMQRGHADSKEVVRALNELTSLLGQVLCRTERPITRSQPPKSLPTLSLGVKDVRSLRDFAGWIKRAPAGKGERLDHVQWVVPLWSSVPLPSQALGKKYVCWTQAGDAGFPIELRLRHLQGWQVPDWSSVKLRWLLSALPRSQISMPWVSPSSPWWPLGGGWSESLQDGQISGKALVFSRFSATPSALAGTVSFDIEASAIRSSIRARPPYKSGARASFKPGGLSPAMFRLFFVCGSLLKLDPLAGEGPATLAGAKARAAVQLRCELERLQITVKRRLRRTPLSQESWLLILEHLASGKSSFEAELPAVEAWREAVLLDGGKATRGSVNKKLKGYFPGAGGFPMEMDLHREFWPLVELALSSPGIVLARALRRHWLDGKEPVSMDQSMPIESGRRLSTPRRMLQSLVVAGLRRYLDRPWFAAALIRRSKTEFPDAMRQAVLDGNLEAVLDEHFWFIAATTSKGWPERVAELQAALNLGGGRSILHTGKSQSIRVRSNVALPLHQPKDEAANARKRNRTSQSGHAGTKGKRTADEVRPDVVRHAFNTPFWPMVLATTSVGQEGLDFHAWCKTVVHWDPAAGPVELEQREGRVNRYAGLAVRQAISTAASRPDPSGGNAPAVDRTCWNRLALFAEQQLSDPEGSGLSPWWCAEGTQTVQMYPHPAGSREASIRESLERRRAIYRMVLGASEPLWLLDELEAAHSGLKPEQIEQATLQLGAWTLEQRTRYRP